MGTPGWQCMCVGAQSGLTQSSCYVTKNVTGVDSARWPNSNPPGGVAQGTLLIPVISSEGGVDGGGVEQHDGNGSGTSRSGR